MIRVLKQVKTSYAKDAKAPQGTRRPTRSISGFTEKNRDSGKNLQSMRSNSRLIAANAARQVKLLPLPFFQANLGCSGTNGCLYDAHKAPWYCNLPRWNRYTADCGRTTPLRSQIAFGPVECSICQDLMVTVEDYSRR